MLFSPDDRVLVIWENLTEVLDFAINDISSRLRLVDRVTGRPIGREVHVPNFTLSAAFSPDGRFFVTGSSDGFARIWDRATFRQVGSGLRHTASVRRVEFSTDGRCILTASADGTASIWEFAGEDLVAIERGKIDDDHVFQEPWPRRAGMKTRRWRWDQDGSDAIAPEGDRAIQHGDGLVRLLEASTGQPTGRPILARWPIFTTIAFSPDGRRVAIPSTDNDTAPYTDDKTVWSACQVWDTATGRPVSPLLPHQNWPGGLAFSPDGKTLAVGDYGGYVSLWDVETGRLIGGRRLGAGAIVVNVAFSPNGRFLAAATAENAMQVVLWDRESLGVLGKSVRFSDYISSLAFSPDSTLLAASSKDGTIRVIDTLLGRVRSETRTNGSSQLAFTGDGRHILTAANYLRAGARLWDPSAWEPASPLMTHDSEIFQRPSLGPNGTELLVIGSFGPARLWDLTTFHRIGPGRPLRTRLCAARFSHDGKSFTALDIHGNVGSWPVPQPLDEPLDRLAARLKVRTGYELDVDGVPHAIDPARWRQLRESLGESGGTGDDADVSRWHESSARDAEALGDGFGARWHLDRLVASRAGDALLYARRARTWLWSDDVASAENDLRRALEIGPRDRILDWMLHRAIDFRYEQRPLDALRLFDRVIIARPADWLSYALRADVHAGQGDALAREADIDRALERDADVQFVLRIANERASSGRWAEAALLFDRAIAQGVVPYEVWMQAATAHLELDDEPGYRRVCDALLAQQPREIFEPLIAVELADVTTLGAGGPSGDDKALGWIRDLPARASSAPQIKRAFLLTKGAVLHRMGQQREAIAAIDEAVALARGQTTPEESLFLALAHKRSGDRDKARAALSGDRGEEPTIKNRAEWWSARCRKLLRREAARLILDPDFPANPFAR